MIPLRSASARGSVWCSLAALRAHPHARRRPQRRPERAGWCRHMGRQSGRAASIDVQFASDW